MPGQGAIVGLTAKLGLDMDDREVESETSGLKDKIEQSINESEGAPSADTSDLVDDIMDGIQEGADGAATGMFDQEEFDQIQEQFTALGQEMPGRIGRPSMDAPTGEDEGGGMGLEGLMAAGGKFLKVGLAGAVGFGILSKVTQLADASPRMTKALSMMSRAIRLFARPFYDWLAKTMEGGIMDLLEVAAQFNKDYQKNGLKVAVQNLAEGAEESAKDKAGGWGKRIDERLFGEGGPSPFEDIFRAEVAAIFGGFDGFGRGMDLWGDSFEEDPIGNILSGIVIAIEESWNSFFQELGYEGSFTPITDAAEGFKDWKEDNLPLYDVGAVLEDFGESMGDWEMPSFPGWTGQGGIMPAFPDSWLGVIIDTFPGWIKSSPGVIDKFPGWNTWLNPLNWDVPGVGDIMASISNHIDDLDWNVPSVGQLGSIVGSKVGSLNWNIPSTKQMLDAAVDEGKEAVGGGGGGGGGGSGGLLGRAKSAAGGAKERWFGAKGGLVTSPTDAVIGESGPEVVAPFSDFMETLDRERERPSPGGGNAPQTQSAGGSGGGAGEVVRAVEDLRDEIKKLDLDGDVILDEKKVGEVRRDNEQRYGSARKVTK